MVKINLGTGAKYNTSSFPCNGNWDSSRLKEGNEIIFILNREAQTYAMKSDQQ